MKQPPSSSVGELSSGRLVEVQLDRTSPYESLCECNSQHKPTHELTLKSSFFLLSASVYCSHQHG